MTSTEARRIVAHHGDTIPAPAWPPASDEVKATLRDMGHPTLAANVRRSA